MQKPINALKINGLNCRLRVFKSASWPVKKFMDNMTDKLDVLIKNINQFKSLVIAFSGGVDSSFLAAVMEKKCNVNAVAVTAVTEFQSEKEFDNAVYMGRQIGISHAFVKLELLKNKKIILNDSKRCYLCKKAIFQALRNYADNLGITNIVHGANLDDLNDFRPGALAAKEMGILSPLTEAGMDKEQIRSYSREMGLETWDMPSQSCLAARIQYNTVINAEKLSMVEKSEQFLASLGFINFRVRCHGTIARIELMPAYISRIAKESIREKIVMEFKKLGFSYITIDLEGYVQGSMNRAII